MKSIAAQKVFDSVEAEAHVSQDQLVGPLKVRVLPKSLRNVAFS